jgi:hypothetical protein
LRTQFNVQGLIAFLTSYLQIPSTRLHFATAHQGGDPGTRINPTAASKLAQSGTQINLSPGNIPAYKYTNPPIHKSTTLYQLLPHTATVPVTFPHHGPVSKVKLE